MSGKEHPIYWRGRADGVRDVVSPHTMLLNMKYLSLSVRDANRKRSYDGEWAPILPYRHIISAVWNWAGCDLEVTQDQLTNVVECLAWALGQDDDAWEIFSLFVENAKRRG